MPGLKKLIKTKNPIVFVALLLLMCILSSNLYIATKYTARPNMPFEVIVDKDVLKEVMGVHATIQVENQVRIDSKACKSKHYVNQLMCQNISLYLQYIFTVTNSSAYKPTDQKIAQKSGAVLAKHNFFLWQLYE
jgi:hypothetical protein